jgi:hypothetical protein
VTNSVNDVEPVAAFCDAVTELSCANASSRAWWYTWLSTRDRFNSGVFDAYLGAATGASEKVAKGGWLRGFVRFAKEAAAAFEGWVVARRHPAQLDRSANVIVVAPTADKTIGWQNEPYCDPYFGKLLDWLHAHGEAPLLIGLPQGDRRSAVAGLAERSDIPAAAFHHFLSLGDIVAAILQVARTCFKVPLLELPGGDNARSVIRADLAAARGDILFGLLVERAIGRALTLNPQARVIHTYENNPWERAVAPLSPRCSAGDSTGSARRHRRPRRP